MGLQEALESVGTNGRYQIIHFTCLFSVFAPLAMWSWLSIIYQGYTESHRCAVPNNVSVDDVIPTEIGPGGDIQYARCHMYETSNSNHTISCNIGWHYEQNYFKNTIVSQTNRGFGSPRGHWFAGSSPDPKVMAPGKNQTKVLRSTYVDLVTILLNIGTFLGGMFGTYLGDIFGRRPVLAFSILLQGIFGIATAFSPSIIVFGISMLIRGLLCGTMYTEGLVLAAEIIPPKSIILLLPATGIFTTIGTLTMLLVAYLFRKWQDYQLVLSCLNLLMLIYLWWCPESLKWLLSKGKFVQARDILHKMARVNGKTFNEETLQGNIKETTKDTQNSTCSILREYMGNRKLATYQIIMCYSQFVAGFVNYGLYLLLGSLPGSIFMNSALIAIISLIGYLLSSFVNARFGRRWSLVMSSILMVMLFFSAGIVQYFKSQGRKGLGTLVIVLVQSTRLPATVHYAVTLVYGQELVPTKARSTLYGIQNGAAFGGCLVVPFVSFSLSQISNWIPAMVFGSVALPCVFLSLLCPETVNRGLPDTTQEIAMLPKDLTNEEWTEVKRRASLKILVFERFNGKNEEGIKTVLENNKVTKFNQISPLKWEVYHK